MNAHASEFGSLIGNQNQLCGDAEQRYEAAKQKAAEKEAARDANEKYLPSEKFRETADKCRETHKTIYSSYAEAKSLCDGMVASHTVNSKDIRKRLAWYNEIPFYRADYNS